MNKPQVALSENEITQLRAMVLEHGLEKAAALLEVSRQTVASLIAALPCTRTTVRAVKARLAELRISTEEGGSHE